MDRTIFRQGIPQNLGLHVQLGHGGSACPCPSPGPPSFMVFDISGIHVVNIDYCECPKDDRVDRKSQLLRHSWFPATFTRPNTIFTFDLLDIFHENMLQGKGNIYDFYHLLLWKTDNSNISDTIVSVILYLFTFILSSSLSSIDTKNSIVYSESEGI